MPEYKSFSIKGSDQDGLNLRSCRPQHLIGQLKAGFIFPFHFRYKSSQSNAVPRLADEYLKFVGGVLVCSNPIKYLSLINGDVKLAALYHRVCRFSDSIVQN